MLVFVDESGCSGFKLARGSDAVFAIAMVIFENRECALRTARRIGEFRARTGHRDEIKFSKSSDRTRDKFFEAVAACPFSIRALIVEKERVHRESLQAHHHEFYRFFIGELAQRASGVLKDVKLSVDGSGDRHFQRALKRYLAARLQGKLTDFQLVDSRKDELIQLADMCVGAIARAYRTHNIRDRWFRMLEPRIDDVWQFR